MTATSHDSLTRVRQPEISHDCPNALFQELGIFRPSPALQAMNALLSTVPVDLGKLGKAVQGGSALAEEAVRLCNSSLFALSRPVSSLEQAVVATDTDLVRTLLLTCWLTKLTGSKVTVSENRMFWSHSLLVAQISRRIGDWAGLAQTEQVFLAGLLHDAGALPIITLLSRNKNPESQNIFEDLGESIDSQRLRFGTDHCELGQKLNAILDFPLTVAEVIAGHHQRRNTLPATPALAIVGCAEVIAQVCDRWAKHELRAGEVEPLVKEALRAWLASLDFSASLPLVAALRSDLMENIRRFGPGIQSAWDDSFSPARVVATMERSPGSDG